MKLRKEPWKNGGYIIYCKIGNSEYQSWWSAPPMRERNFDLDYLKDRYDIITTKKRAEEFSKQWSKLWIENDESTKPTRGKRREINIIEDSMG